MGSIPIWVTTSANAGVSRVQFPEVPETQHYIFETQHYHGTFSKHNITFSKMLVLFSSNIFETQQAW